MGLTNLRFTTPTICDIWKKKKPQKKNILPSTLDPRQKDRLAEHSFRARFSQKNWKKTNMPSIERSFYLLDTRSICAIFLYNWTQCIDGFSLLSQRYVRIGNDAKNPAILSFFFVNERTQLNAAHA